MLQKLFRTLEVLILVTLGCAMLAYLIPVLILFVDQAITLLK